MKVKIADCLGICNGVRRALDIVEKALAECGNNTLYVYNEIVHLAVSQLAVCDGAIFIKNGDGVLRVSIKDSLSEQIASGDGKMLVYDRTTALVCSDAKAVYLKFAD